MQTIQVITVVCLAGVAVTLASHQNYDFNYGVADLHTGDVKSQSEKGHGGHVTGYYKLKEADGTERIVHYSADKHNGFTAHVERRGHAYHPEHYHNYGHHGYGHYSGYGHGGYGHYSGYGLHGGYGLHSGYGGHGGYGHDYAKAYSYQNFNLKPGHYGGHHGYHHYY